MKRYLFIILLVSINLFFAINSYSQDNNNYKSVSQFANETVGYLEGFANSISGNDFSYHSLRNDPKWKLASIARDTNPKLGIRIKTKDAPNTAFRLDVKTYSFLFKGE